MKADTASFPSNPHLGGLKWMRDRWYSRGRNKNQAGSNAAADGSAGAGYLFFSIQIYPKNHDRENEKTDEMVKDLIEGVEQVVVSYQF